MKYELHVYCRRGGVTRDAGVHAHYECADDDEAKSKVGADLPFLTTHYDTVGWWLTSDDDRPVIAQGTAYGRR